MFHLLSSVATSVMLGSGIFLSPEAKCDNLRNHGLSRYLDDALLLLHVIGGCVMFVMFAGRNCTGSGC